MSAEVRPWDPFLRESAKMVCSNRLDLVPARTLLDALYHQTSFIAIECFLENIIHINELYNRLRTASHRCPQRYEFPVERPPGRRLLSASLDKVGHRPPVAGGLGVHREYSALRPASVVPGKTHAPECDIPRNIQVFKYHLDGQSK
jgi:hypothetical protein